MMHWPHIHGLCSVSWCLAEGQWNGDQRRPMGLYFTFLLYTHTHTHTTVLLLFWNMSGTTRVSRYQKGNTRMVKTNLDLLEQEIVSGSGI